MKKKLLITFDYELFLGRRSGSVKNCLIQPTYELLEVLNRHKIKAIFFVDLTYLSQLNSIKNSRKLAMSDFKEIETQLRKIQDTGHKIYWHIHPHWLDAIYLPKINQWDLSSKKRFAISNLTQNEISYVFQQSYEILKEFKLNEQAVGFRAGGLYVQPFSKLKPFFKKYNIHYDFSVLQGAKSSDGKGQFSFDYSDCPKLPVYRFSNDVNKIDENGPFTEVSMKQIELKNGYKIVNGLLYRLMKKHSHHIIIGDGKSSGNVINKPATRWKNYFRVFETVSIEMINPVRARLYMKELKKNNFIHFISHPKLFSPYCIKQFDLFLKKAKRNFIIETDFKKIIEHQSRSNGE
jgi:hypothetical protein